MENNYIRKVLADNLRRCRQEQKMTQTQLADLIGYSEKSVSKWESGAGMPPAAVLPILAEVLRTDINSLFCQNKEWDYFLGIDGGGTKTDFVLAGKNGVLLERIQLKGCNPVDIGMKGTCDILQEGIYRICNGIPLSRVSVFAGIAGGGVGDGKQKIKEFLKKFNFARVENGNDAMNAIALFLEERDGILVILGTGSIAFASVGKRAIKVGGYGYLIGDKGSGFALGRDVLFAALEAEAGHGEETVLKEKVLKICKTNTVEENIPVFYDGGKRRIASFAPVLLEACDEKDSVALKILEENMKAVAELITNAAKNLPGIERIPVAICGGIANRGDLILPYIQKYLINNENKQYMLKACTEPIYKGALILAGMKRDDFNDRWD